MANDSHGYDDTFALERELIRQSYIGNNRLAVALRQGARVPR